MKTSIRKAILALTVIASLSSTALFAQDNRGRKHEGTPRGGEWRERMESARTQFITNELGLTKAEADRFWPVYREISGKRNRALGASGAAFKKLDDAVRNGQESGALLDAYIKAQQDVSDINAMAVKEYRKVLPAEKVAKLFVIEENFRRHLLDRLGSEHAPHHHWGGHPGN